MLTSRERGSPVCSGRKMEKHVLMFAIFFACSLISLSVNLPENELNGFVKKQSVVQRHLPAGQEDRRASKLSQKFVGNKADSSSAFSWIYFARGHPRLASGTTTPKTSALLPNVSCLKLKMV